MKKTKKLLAFVLASAMMVSNVAYAAPVSGEPSESDATVDTFSFENPKTDTGESSPEDASGSGDAAAADQQPGQGTGDVTGSTAADTASPETAPEQTTPPDQPTAPESADAAAAGSSQTEPDSTAGAPSDTAGDETAGGEETADEEGTGTSQEQTEAALYDVTFTTPEKHGKILRMDDTEVTDGTALKTDENGKAQFKVKADDGYQVYKVINKTTGEELKLIEDSYYELQVEVNTTVEVHYNKVPADEKSEDSDDADDADAAETADGAVAEDEAAPSAKIAANLLNMDPMAVEQITVSIVDENDSEIEGAPKTVSEGACETVAPSINGYDFVKATVNGDEIYAIGSFNETIYYVPAEDTDTGLLLGESKIVFHYETHVETYSIMYSADETIKVEGPDSVKDGNAYSFTVTPSGKGKQLNVKVNDTDYSDKGVVVDAASGLTRYTVENVQGNQSVAVTETDVSNYVFTYNNDNIRQGNVTSPESGTVIIPNGTLSFILKSDGFDPFPGINDPAKEWHLNLLAINGEYVNVPTTFNEGDSATTTLNTGEKVTVTLTEKDWQFPLIEAGWADYTYTITVENVYQNISVTDGNFKSSERNEIIIKRLDGVENIIGWDFADEKYVDGTINSVYLQTDETGNEFYFNLAPGYVKPTVTVLANGKETGITVNRVEDLEKPTAKGFEYQFNIPNDLSDNVEVYVTSEVETYTIQYKVDGEVSTEITDDGTYTIFSGNNNETLIKGEPTYDSSKYIFEGWVYNEKTYQPNDVFGFNAESVAGADENGVITFDAKLIPIEGSDYVPYTVQYWFQTEDGKYDHKSGYDSKSGRGLKDSTLFSYEVLTWEIEGYTLNETTSDIVLTLSSDGKNEANIYFDLDKNNNDIPDKAEVEITFTAVNGTFNNGKSSYTVTGGLKNTEGKWDATGSYYLKAEDIHEVGNSPEDGYKPGSWDKKPIVGTEIKGETTFTYTYIKDEAKWATVTFDAGANGTLEGTGSYNVLKGTLFSKIVVPTVKVNSTKWIFNGWKPEFPETITKDVTFTAQYREDNNQDGKPDEEQKLTVEFSAGEHGSFAEGTQTSYSLMHGANYPAAPIPEAESGWVFTGWDKTYPGSESKVEIGFGAEAQTEIYTAQYKVDGNGDGEPDEEQKLTVEFSAGEHGSFAEGTQTSYGLMHGENYPAAPIPEAESGWVFTGWDKTYPGSESKVEIGIGDEARTETYTAQYKVDGNGDGEPDEEQKLTVEFSAGEHGSFAEGTQTSYSLMHGENYPAAPTPEAESGWVFTGWDKTYPGSESKVEIGIGDEARTETYTAQYKVDGNGDGEPDEDQKLTVEFSAGEHGSFAEGTQTSYSLMHGENYPAAPTPEAESGWVFTGWDKTYPGSESKVEIGIGDEARTETYTAQYKVDGNGDGKPDEDQYVNLTFISEYGFVNETGNTLVLEKQVPNLKFEAPTPLDTDSDNVVFTGWNPSLPEGNIVPAEDAEYKAVYKDDLNNNGEPDDEEDLVTITFDTADTTKGYFGEGSQTAVADELLPGIALTTPEGFVDVEADEYAFDGWVDANGNEVTIVPDADATVTAKWADDKNHNNTPDEEEDWVEITFDTVDLLKGYFGENLQTTTVEMLPGAELITPEGFVDVEGDEYAFDGWVDTDGNEVTIVPNTDATLTAKWADDKNHNNNPDEDESYTLVITYAYATGEGGEASELPGIYVESELEVGHEYSVPSKEIEGYVAVPTVVTGTIMGNVTANVLYYKDTNGNGKPDVDESYDLTITYVYAEGEEGEAALPETHTETDLAVGEAYSVPSPAVEGYVAEPEVVEGTIIDQDVNVEVVYHRDTNGNGKPDSEESYDLTITYAYAEGEEGQATLPETHTETDLAVGEAYSVPSPAVEGYVAEPEVVEGTIVDQDVNVEVVYHRDTNGNGEPDVDESYDLTITYAYAEGEEGEATLPETHTEADLAVGAQYKVESPAVEGYVAEPEVVEGTIVDQDVNVEVVYHRDTNGNGEPDVDESYDLTITYAYAEGEEGQATLPETHTETDLAVGAQYKVESPAVEGYVAVPLTVEGTIVDRNVSAEVLYYIDENGNGVPDSEEPDEPTPTPDPDPGTDNPPSTTDPDTDDPDTPITPTAPTTPNPGPTPSGTGPAATTPETRTAQNPDDTDNADDAEAAERYSLTEINSEDGTGRTTRIDEDDTPLGNKDDLSDADAENHDAMCIIHWIVLLAALLAAILFIIDGSRRKNRIKDLRQELENVKNGKNRR